MSLVRILVDGYSLLHSWPELAPREPRHSAAARDELVHVLRLYSDAAGTPVTVVFDGGGHRGVRQDTDSTPQVEILFSKAGQTADQIIERLAGTYGRAHDLTVATDDLLEQQTAAAFGAYPLSTAGLRDLLSDAQTGFTRTLQTHRKRAPGSSA